MIGLNQQKQGQTFEELEQLAKQEAAIKTEVLELYLILLPLQKASICFECEQSRLADSVPIIQTLTNSYQKLLSESYISLYSSIEILSQLFARLETYLPKETWASWVMSRSGIVAGEINDYKDPEFLLNEMEEEDFLANKYLSLF